MYKRQVFALGTNGAATDEQIDELVAAAGPGRQVFFVNTRSPQSWVGQTLSLIHISSHDQTYGMHLSLSVPMI